MIKLEEIKEKLLTAEEVQADIETGTISDTYYTNKVSGAIVRERFPRKVLDLSRDEIFKTKDIRKKLILILVWGYRTDTRNTPKIMEQIDELVAIEEAFRKGQFGGEEYLEKLLAISRLGLSTASKILYFMGVTIDGHPCVIVDKRVESAMSVVVELSGLKHRDNDVKFYKEVIAEVDRLHTELGVPNESIEYFLFTLGRAWDSYMSKLAKREAEEADKAKLQEILDQAQQEADETASGFDSTPRVARLTAGTNVEGRIAIDGYQIAKGGYVLYDIVGRDSKKAFCVVLSKNSKYDDISVNTVMSHEGFVFKKDIGKPYFIRSFKPSEMAEACSLMEALKTELCNEA